MKKAFIQKLSIAMASALVITAAAPATADAAAAMKINRPEKTLYLNQDNMSNTSDTYDFSIKNKPTNYKTKYSFTWYAENDKIVDVAKGGVVTAKKVGSTVVKCDIINKKNGSVKTVTTKVTVKANAATVEVNNAPENNEIAVGTTFDFNRTMKDANGNKATDKTEWFVSADAEGKETTDVASIDKNGVVTALKAGKFFVNVKTYQSAKYKDLGYTAESTKPVEITVPLQMTDIKLTKINTVELTFDSSVKDTVKSAADVKIQTVAANKANYPVKSVAVSEDGKTVTVESYQNFANGTTYSVTAAGSTKEFKAVIGEISNIIVENQTVAPIMDNNGNVDLTKAKKLAYKVVDANGVDLTSNYATLTGSSIVVVSSNNNGSTVQADGTMYMLRKGDSVNVQLKYSKWNDTTKTYDTINSNLATVTCAEATATTTSKWTIADETAGNPYEKTTTSLNANDSNKKLYVTLKDSYNADITPTKYTSLNESILLVDSTGKLYPKSAGTATVKVESGNYVDYLTITVNPASTVQNLVADVSTYSLSNSGSLVAPDSKTVKLTLKDNYGGTFNHKDTVNATITLMSATSVDFVTYSSSATLTKGEGYTTFTAVPGKTGTATFKITAEGKDTFVTITVKAPAGAVDYRIDLSKNEIDNFDASKSATTVKLYNVDGTNTLVSQVATGAAVTYKVKNSKGETKLEGNFTNGNEFTIDAKASNLAVDTYTVEFSIGPVIKTATLKVTSAKKSSAVEPNTVYVKSAGGDLNSALASIFTFKVNGNKVTPVNPVFDVTSLDPDVITGSAITWTTKESGRVAVNKVTFEFEGVSYTVENINVVITVSKN